MCIWREDKRCCTKNVSTKKRQENRPIGSYVPLQGTYSNAQAAAPLQFRVRTKLVFELGTFTFFLNNMTETTLETAVVSGCAPRSGNYSAAEDVVVTRV